MKHVNVEYIESGTFVGGEEDCFNMKVESGKDYVVISRADYDLLKRQNRERLKIRTFIYANSDDDLNFVKFQIGKLDSKK